MRGRREILDLPVLIICHPGDLLAARVCAALQGHLGRGSVRIASDAELMFAREFTQRIDRRGIASVVEFADGFRIASRGIGVVFNRLRSVELQHLDLFEESDRIYAASETHAAWLAWLAGLPCPVLNPPTPRGLCGPQLSAAEWMQLAARAGLTVPSWQHSTWSQRDAAMPRRVECRGPEAVVGAALGRSEPRLRFEALGSESRMSTVIGTEVIGAFATEWKDELVELARSAGCFLIQAQWRRRLERSPNDSGDWCVSAVSSVPDCHDAAVVAAISRGLVARMVGNT